MRENKNSSVHLDWIWFNFFRRFVIVIRIVGRFSGVEAGTRNDAIDIRIIVCRRKVWKVRHERNGMGTNDDQLASNSSISSICTSSRIVFECRVVLSSFCTESIATTLPCTHRRYHPLVPRRARQIFGCEFGFSICFISRVYVSITQQHMEPSKMKEAKNTHTSPNMADDRANWILNGVKLPFEWRH